MASDTKSKNINIYINDDAAVDAYNRLVKRQDQYTKAVDDGKKKIEALEKAIAKSQAAGGKPTALVKELEKQNKALSANEKKLKEVRDEQEKLNKQIKSGTGVSIKQQEAYVRRLSNEYKNLAQNTDEARKKLEELAKAEDQLNKMKNRKKEVGKDQDDVAKKGSGFMNSFFGNLAAGAVAKAGAVIKDFFSGVIDEAMDAEDEAARLQATLDNLGRGEVFDRIMAKSNQMHDQFRNIDPGDVVGVYEQLIDYGKLTEKQMNDLLPVIINFAGKQRISIGESASVMVKAMGGSAKALKEYGVSIKDAETSQERLDIIMTELAGKVDGAGAAFAGTARGGLEEVKIQFKDLQEQIGTKLLPMLVKLLSWTVKAMQHLKGFSGVVADLFSSTTFTASVIENTADVNASMQKAVDDSFKSGLAIFKSGMKDYEKVIKSGKVTEDQAFKEQLDNLKKNNKERGDQIADLKKTLSIGDKENTRRFRTMLVDFRANEKLILELEAERSKGVLGMETKEDKKEPKEDPALKKELEDLKKFDEEAKKIRADLTATHLSEKDKEIQAATEKYEKLRELAHKHYDKLKVVHQLATLEFRQIDAKYDAIEAARKKDLDKKSAEEFKKQVNDLATAGLDRSNKMREAADQALEKKKRDMLAAAQLKADKAFLFKKLDAELEYLELQKKAELGNKDLTENEKALIEDQYRQRRFDAEMQFYSNLFTELINFGQIIQDIFSPDIENQKAREDAELERVQKNNDKQKNSTKKLLDQKLISQQEYNRRVKILDDQYNKQVAATKKKQWERQQKADVEGAIISGSQAVLSALQTKPFILGLVYAALAATKAKKEINTIKNRPVPEFAKGGYLQGPSHAQDGIHMINSQTGAKVGEAEGGEVILSKRTVKENPDKVGALLHASMYNSGKLTPFWRSRAYRPIDEVGISQGILKTRYYQNGGVIGESSTGFTQQGGQVIMMEDPEQKEILRAMLEESRKPTKAYVTYSDIQTAGSMINQIQDDAVFR